MEYAYFLREGAEPFKEEVGTTHTPLKIRAACISSKGSKGSHVFERRRNCLLSCQQNTGEALL